MQSCEPFASELYFCGRIGFVPYIVASGLLCNCYLFYTKTLQSDIKFWFKIVTVIVKVFVFCSAVELTYWIMLDFAKYQWAFTDHIKFLSLGINLLSRKLHHYNFTMWQVLTQFWLYTVYVIVCKRWKSFMFMSYS